jgi:hypothetical protein
LTQSFRGLQDLTVSAKRVQGRLQADKKAHVLAACRAAGQFSKMKTLFEGYRCRRIIQQVRIDASPVQQRFYCHAPGLQPISEGEQRGNSDQWGAWLASGWPARIQRPKPITTPPVSCYHPPNLC